MSDIRISLNQSIQIMAAEIDAVLDRGLHGFWLYGSVVLDDFRPGWSDIVFFALANGPSREEQAKLLLTL